MNKSHSLIRREGNKEMERPISFRHINIYTFIDIYTHKYIFIYIYIYICLYVYIYIYLLMHSSCDDLQPFFSVS